MSEPDLFETAVSFHEKGQVAEAELYYRQFLDEKPGHPEALHLRGMALYSLNRPDEAAENIRDALRKLSDRADVYANFGLVLKSLGKFREAIDSLSQALALQPDYPECTNNLASTYLAFGQTNDAFEILVRLAETHPDYAEGRNNLGVLLIRRGDLDEATRHLQAATSLNNGYVEAFINLGHAHVQKTNYGRAIPAFERAVQLEPANVETLRDLADALSHDGQHERAMLVMENALAVEPNSIDNIVSVGNVHLLSGDLEKAEEQYQTVLLHDPDNVRANNNLGSILMQRNDPQGALQAFLKACQEDPDFVDALFNVGSASQQLGDLTTAELYYGAALARRPGLFSAYRCLATIYRMRGQIDNMREMIESWFAHDPASPTATHLLAAARSEAVPERASDEYIREEFDAFADQFDETLAQLEYRTPEMLTGLVTRMIELPGEDADILDAGCGTGLCGPHLRKLSSSIVGVDLSKNMLRRARKRGDYMELVEGELLAFMQSHPASFDLLISADTLVYFGMLEDVMLAAQNCLRPGGFLAFSVERADNAGEDGYTLAHSGRYAHDLDYVAKCVSAAGFRILREESATLRIELDKPIDGLLVVAQRDEGED
jgi:predicted TPR repeat methyltransferase